MLFKTAVRSSAVCALGLIVSGCGSSGYPAVDTPALYESLVKDLKAPVIATDMDTPLNITAFEALEVVCNNEFENRNYEFDGVTMRAKVYKYGYKMPSVSEDAILYRHEYAVCHTFYPVNEHAVQEAVYVKYLATIDSTAANMMVGIHAVEGGLNGLLQHAGFHRQVDVPANGWSQIDTVTYKETSKVQYLKMNPIEMMAVHKYDAEKFKDLLAFEMVSANVTRVDGKIVFSNVDIATVQNRDL